MGYGESKLVAELILGKASEKCGVPISIMRIGQIAGSTDASDPSWAIQEWVPALVKTSKSLNLVPNNLPSIDWIPIDQLAIVIVELMQHGLNTFELLVYNLVNPHRSPWGFCSWASNAILRTTNPVCPTSNMVEETRNVTRKSRGGCDQTGVEIVEVFHSYVGRARCNKIRYFPRCSSKSLSGFYEARE